MTDLIKVKNKYIINKNKYIIISSGAQEESICMFDLEIKVLGVWIF